MNYYRQDYRREAAVSIKNLKRSLRRASEEDAIVIQGSIERLQCFLLGVRIKTITRHIDDDYRVDVNAIKRGLMMAGCP